MLFVLNVMSDFSR